MRGQATFFEGIAPLIVSQPIRLVELFAGIGSQAKALENLGARFEHYRVCEFDGNAIRKLTPKEFWRLMGFSDTDFEAAAKVNSKEQLYHQAGNSIVVDVLMAIFREMLCVEKAA